LVVPEIVIALRSYGLGASNVVLQRTMAALRIVKRCDDARLAIFVGRGRDRPPVNIRTPSAAGTQD